MFSSVEFIFWISVFIIAYVYVGYGILLSILVKFKKKKKPTPLSDAQLPTLSLLVAAYNEKEIVDIKIKNSLQLNYPKEKLKLVWVTDGSNDGTPEYIAEKYPFVTVLHNDERRGKTAALNRAIELIDTPIIVCCDANTMLNTEALREITTSFTLPNVGLVGGEKKVRQANADDAASSGESTYWKYESWQKKTEAQFYSAIAVAGELFAIKKDLYVPIPEDTILDDFVLSLHVIEQGYIIAYNPNAYATEESSANISEEIKRKIRISAGGFQTIFRYPQFLNIFKHPLYSFEYFSHKLLRWLVVPFAFIIVFFLNLYLALYSSQHWHLFYQILALLQIIYYLLAFLGWTIRNKKTQLKILFIPFYISLMNWTTILGLFRYLKKNQNQRWEKASRKKA